MKIRFPCPECEAPARLELSRADIPVCPAWQCPRCDHLGEVEADDGRLARCLVCGNHELYRKKDFPHWLGLTILTVACLASVIPYALHRPGWTWGILLGSAVFDGLLYLWVRDVTVCYRCGAEYRGLPAGVRHPPHELSVAERYRQERIRREQLRVTGGERRE